MRKGEAESPVVMDVREEAGAATRSAAARGRERGRECEWSSASSSGEGGGRGRAHLVADQGASTLAHARHVGPNAAGVPRRRGAAVHARGHGSRAWRG